MDYTKQPLLFRVKKALRYTRLYGPGRTLIKIRGQYHMRRKFAALPAPRIPQAPGRHVGFLGCGNFAYANIAYYLKKDFGAVIQGVMDVDANRAASLCLDYDANYHTTDPARIIEDPAVDMIFIASNHASHAEYAIAALKLGKHVHIEKPHVVSEDQLIRLCRAAKQSSGRINLGFNRPGSPIGCKLKALLDAEQGPAMFNWFIAGHEIQPDHWYFHPAEGGRVLGNLCHWTDFVFQMMPPEKRYPIVITPAASRSPSDFSVSFSFGDGSVAAFTFSAKGHTFEGVRERLSVHKGNLLAMVNDFHDLKAENVEKQQTTRHLFRNHGHRKAVRDGYALRQPGTAGASLAYVWETAELFLKTNQALEEHREIEVRPFSDDRIR